MARQRATTVQLLVDAAARVFERKGFTDATISDIATEAGVSKPTVYQYVNSKRWLLETIVEQLIYPLKDGIDQIMASDRTEREKLAAYLRLHVDNAIKYQTYYLVLTADQHQLSTQALRNYRSWARDVNAATENLLTDCVKAGVVRSDLDIGIVTNLLNGLLVSVTSWYRPSGRVGAEALYQHIHDMLAGFIEPERHAGTAQG
ncbi:TetR family transcriptional regulator [Tamaricihabitans halophyticus]|uniref:TetR family transcriptional regulator n=1 Tax=Tamaricihabitans halophyticus TaxID=1262583 RepID=A0A4R2Q5Q9_9PSEU|nr:TetR/AcrR family transcriptional regulator [Tamaricihabitans halophyticus]TCP42051.1 TetR family transcriptional regulator [Tamaricihabitans halophyticus]